MGSKRKEWGDNGELHLTILQESYPVSVIVNLVFSATGALLYTFSCV